MAVTPIAPKILGPRERERERLGLTPEDAIPSAGRGSLVVQRPQVHSSGWWVGRPS